MYNPSHVLKKITCKKRTGESRNELLNLRRTGGDKGINCSKDISLTLIDVGIASNDDSKV